jgi:hypothetical protein
MPSLSFYMEIKNSISTLVEVVIELNIRSYKTACPYMFTEYLHTCFCAIMTNSKLSLSKMKITEVGTYSHLDWHIYVLSS